MLLEPDGSPAWRSEDVLRGAARSARRARARPRPTGSALELATDPHATVGERRRSCAPARRARRDALGRSGCAPRSPARTRSRAAEDVEVSPGARYQFLHGSLRELARREPTFALHVHVAVPDAELAVRALNGMRAHLPVLLALSANSPFWQGRDSGLASARTPLFQAFPRVGIPRAFAHLRRVRRGDRRAGALRRDPRADVPLVGRAAAAAARHARGPRDGRPDARPRHRRAGRAGAVPGAARGARGAWPSRSWSTRPRCSTRTASWPRATASTRSSSTRTRDRCVPAARPPGHAGRRLPAARPALGCERELALLARLAGDPGAARQRAIAAERRPARPAAHAGGGVLAAPPRLAARRLNGCSTVVVNHNRG